MSNGNAPAGEVVLSRLSKSHGEVRAGSPLEHLKVRELVALMASYYPHPLPVADV
jgi:hypothetical protein